MKTVFSFLLLIFSTTLIGQYNFDTTKLKKIYADKLASADLSTLWLKSKTDDVVGFISTSFQRFQIHFISIIKDNPKGNIYLIKGKSKVKGNICDFEGIISVTKVEGDDAFVSNGDFGDTIRQGSITATYLFKENQTQKYTGVFEGTMTTLYYLDSFYNVHYDNLMNGADGYSNNTCTGTWTSYDQKLKKPCNWGISRIPDCGDLDVGTGEFIPNPKYIKNGWEDYCWNCTDEQIKKYQADKSQSRWWE